MALQLESKFQVYRELKWEIGIDEWLEYLKGALSRLFLKFHSSTHKLFEELGKHTKGVWVTGLS